MSAGFVVLPDTPGTPPPDEAYPFAAPRLIPHPSGRPWLVGSWEPDEIRQVTVGPVRVVVIGRCPVTTTHLEGLCRRLRTLADVDALARQLPGSFHLVAAAGNATRVQGSVTGLRQVFHARLDGGIPVAADRADALAALTGAGIDEHALALRVVCGGMLPPPLSDRSAWTGVSTVPHDHCLVLEPDRARERRWWSPPAPELGLEEGASAVREALVTAVDGLSGGLGVGGDAGGGGGPDGGSGPGAGSDPEGGRGLSGDGRTGVGSGLSADMSGGMDSTSLAFLTARHTPDLLTFRWAEAETGNDDARFAALAAAELPGAHHLVVAQSDLPSIFTDPAALADTERPYLYTRSQARMRHTAAVLAAHGSRRHVAGHGADELFGRMPGYLHRLARRHPLTLLRHLRGSRALGRWPLWGCLTQLARAESIAQWWRAQADDLTAPPPPPRLPSIGWGLAPLRAPAWATGIAIDAARAALRATAEHARPLADDRGPHQNLAALRITSPAYRQVSRLFAAEGVRLEQPFLDDRVVEAVLAVRPHERTTPWQYKPLLARSMRGLVPDAVLDRTSKGDFSADLRAGRQANLAAIIDVFSSGTVLADLGLIDPESVRAYLLAPQADSSRDIAVEQLLGCETWARAARSPLPLGSS
ncbi:asparagine synthase-related protein [Streptomyces flavofungini]|uniref:asparagine synthase-related protein n=1 Tax=Streptomyces flavofungini TaxID=68200 RepID=UPI0025B1B729|nr:asparagine synthase-related protein [Streptomyces flavofungini]WJV44470.1 asparagine synthase-related protein [Streptomyces flavofungini]